MWELKKKSLNPSCTTKNASKQLEGYIQGRLKRNQGLELKLPSVTNIKSGEFDKTRNGYNYHVHYWNEGNGILRYNYTKEKPEERQVAEATVAIMFFIISVFMSFVAGAPVYV